MRTVPNKWLVVRRVALIDWCDRVSTPFENYQWFQSFEIKWFRESGCRNRVPPSPPNINKINKIKLKISLDISLDTVDSGVRLL